MNWCAVAVCAVAVAEEVRPTVEGLFGGVRAVPGCTVVATIFEMVGSKVIDGGEGRIVVHEVTFWKIAQIHQRVLLFGNFLVMYPSQMLHEMIFP